MVWVSGVILLAILQYLVFAMLVGAARGRYGIQAPACTGHPIFERWFRVQQNSLEQLIAFVPAMWLFGWWVSQTWAAGIGIVFVAARIIYAAQYVSAPESRKLGAGLSFITVIALVVGALVGMVRFVLKG